MIDQIIVGIYFIIAIFIGLMVAQNIRTMRDFAIGHRNFPTLVLLATTFATVIDGGGTVGLAETVYALGPMYCVSFLAISFGYFGLAQMLAPKFAPFFGLISSGDILGQLYGRKAKVFMGFATIFESTMLIGMQLLAITHIMQYFFSLSKETAAWGATAVILLYSLRGGIRAVTATDVFQFGILIVALPLMAGIIFFKAGGIGALQAALNNPPATVENIDYLKHFSMIATFALPALFPRALQRMLMAKNISQIKQTFMLTGLLCIPLYLLMGTLGISAWVLSPGMETNLVFANLMNQGLPMGIKGFVIAGLLAVFMSSIDSDLNLSSIAIAHDIVVPLTKKPISDEGQLRIARGSSIVVAGLSVILSLYFGNVMSMIYFLLCISNSAFFPGYFLGILGFKPGKTGFWVGLTAACCSVVFCTFVLDLFILYTGLISIFLNAAILFGYHVQQELGRKTVAA